MDAFSLNDEVKDVYSYVLNLRRHFHMYPEVSKCEYKTRDKIELELSKLGIPYKRVNETGVYAKIIGRNEDKTIILRADIDALPIEEMNDSSYKSLNKGVMHACGHDAHTACLLGAAKILNEHKNELQGSIELHFQQAEEIGFGARQFINEGLVNDRYRCFGIHLASNIKCGKIALVSGANNASVDFLRINVHGVSSHVGTPELGVDALYIASQIVVSLQGLITRRTAPTDSVLLGIGKLCAGTSYNIIAESAYLEGTLRCFSFKTRIRIKQQIEDLADNIARSYGGLVDILWEDYTSPLVNEEIYTNEAIKIAERYFDKNSIISNRVPSLSGDDFAEYLLITKGCYAYVGSANELLPNTLLPHHNSKFDIDEECLKVGVKLLTSYAFEMLK